MSEQDPIVEAAAALGAREKLKADREAAAAADAQKRIDDLEKRFRAGVERALSAAGFDLQPTQAKTRHPGFQPAPSTVYVAITAQHKTATPVVQYTLSGVLASGIGKDLGLSKFEKDASRITCDRHDIDVQPPVTVQVHGTVSPVPGWPQLVANAMKSIR